MIDAQFARDSRDFVGLGGEDATVGGRDREEALDDGEPFVGGGHLCELSRDEEVVGAAEQPLLVLGHLDNQRRLGGRHAAAVGDELFHGPRFVGRDLMIGAGDAAQDESERREIAGARWFEPVEFGGDAVDGVAVGFRVAGETKKGQDRAHRSILPAFANAALVVASLLREGGERSDA